MYLDDYVNLTRAQFVPQTYSVKAPNRNKRHYPRFKLDVRVTCMTGEMNTIRGAIGRTVDISEGGIAILVPTKLELGQTFDILFNMPQSPKALQLKVIVRSKDSYRYRCQFLFLSSQQRQDIAQGSAALEPVGSER